MTDDSSRGLLDTSVVIGLAAIPPEHIPSETYLSAITLAELVQGVHMTADAAERGRRLERVQWAEKSFRRPLPFDENAARLYGTLIGLVVSAGRNPRPRRIDLMIAATAASNDLPLYTRNAKDLAGIESRLRVVLV